MSTFLGMLILLGLLAAIVGVIGLFIAAARQSGTRTRWLIVFIIGAAAVFIGFIGFTVMGSSSSDKDTIEQEATEAEEPAEGEPAEGDAVEEGEAEPAAMWVLDASLRPSGTTTSIVAGDEKSVTLRFEYSWGRLFMYFFDSVTIGDTTYRIDDGTENGFEGLPIIARTGDNQYDHFVGGVSVEPDKPVDVTFTMIDGGDLPDTFVITYDAQDTWDDLWSGKIKNYDYSNGTFTISRI